MASQRTRNKRAKWKRYEWEEGDAAYVVTKAELEAMKAKQASRPSLPWEMDAKNRRHEAHKRLDTRSADGLRKSS